MTMRIAKSVLLLCLGSLGLAACGGGLEGRYVFGAGEGDGGGGEGITLELRGGDVAVVSIAGISSLEGTWSAEGDTVTVRMADGDQDTFTVHEDGLMTEGFGEQMVFVKQ
jgi:hypothetical protein